MKVLLKLKQYKNASTTTTMYLDFYYNVESRYHALYIEEWLSNGWLIGWIGCLDLVVMMVLE